MNNLLKLALCMLPMALSAEYYTRPAVLHMDRNGKALLELDEHLYEIDYFQHSEDCNCIEYFIDPSNRDKLAN